MLLLVIIISLLGLVPSLISAAAISPAVQDVYARSPLLEKICLPCSFQCDGTAYKKCYSCSLPLVLVNSPTCFPLKDVIELVISPALPLQGDLLRFLLFDILFIPLQSILDLLNDVLASLGVALPLSLIQGLESGRLVTQDLTAQQLKLLLETYACLCASGGVPLKEFIQVKQCGEGSTKRDCTPVQSATTGALVRCTCS